MDIEYVSNKPANEALPLWPKIQKAIALMLIKKEKRDNLWANQLYNASRVILSLLFTSILSICEYKNC